MEVGCAKNKQKVLRNDYIFYLCICRLNLDTGTNTKLSIHHTRYHNSQKQNGIRRMVLNIHRVVYLKLWFLLFNFISFLLRLLTVYFLYKWICKILIWKYEGLKTKEINPLSIWRNSVKVVYMLQSRQPGFNSRQALNFIITTSPRLALWLTHPPVRWLLWILLYRRSDQRVLNLIRKLYLQLISRQKFHRK